jgi:hypothetical protein
MATPKENPVQSTALYSDRLSSPQSDADTKKYTVAIAVLVILGVMGVSTATFLAHRGREHAKALRASVAGLGFAELLRQQQACELDAATGRGSSSPSTRLDPAYCGEVAHAVAAQPLQLVDVPPPGSDAAVPKSAPDRRADYEHDPREIGEPASVAH